jgi:uroporphyrin-III C-methyltransferase/precorrin-2 dehydrogenase/sirohydrochlorin ferrochelatase
MEHLPVFLDVKGRKIIVCGEQTIAARRVEASLRAGANVHLFAENPGGEFHRHLQHEKLTHHKRTTVAGDMKDALIAYGASEDAQENEQLYYLAKANDVLVNVADDTEFCDFITPSIIDRSPLVVAISSSGNAPILARILRARIESMLPATYGRLAKFAGGFRETVMKNLKKPESRRNFWEHVIDGSVGDLFMSGDEDQAAEKLLHELDEATQEKEIAKNGAVFLVGAGPGDPDLLTFRALRLMQRADVVVYDRLIGDDIMSFVRRDAERIYVGKMPNQHTMLQEDISQLLVDLAKQGKNVLRLKGGDPFIFGRGGEEMDLLAENNIPFQVVPGITAASGCSTYSGIPLTHRDHAQSCVFVTAHGKNGVLELDWNSLIQPTQTVVVYMGLSSLGILMEQLAAHGADPETPAAVIDNGTRPEQRIVTGTISNLHEKVLEAQFSGPSMIIIGSVVTLREKLRWFGATNDPDYSFSITARENL